MKRLLLLTAGLALPYLLFAQAPSGVSLDRDRLLVGETVTVVVNFEAASRWCGLRVDLGDGSVLPCAGRARTAALEVVEVQRDEPVSSRQLDLQANGVVLKEIKKKYRGWYRREDASQHNGEIEFERAYGRHDYGGRREQVRRTSPPRRQPADRGPRSDAAPSSAPLPVPAQVPAPAPANGKPPDGSLKVF